MKIKHECRECSGTGLYSGFCEPKGTAVVCIGCGGKGWAESTFRKFIRRKRKKGITKIQMSAGKFIATGVGGIGKPMTYAEFESAIKP